MQQKWRSLQSLTQTLKRKDWNEGEYTCVSRLLDISSISMSAPWFLMGRTTWWNLKIWFSDQLKISWNTVVTVIRKIRVGHNNSNQRCSSRHPRMIPQIVHHLQSSTEAQMVKCFSLGTGVFNGNLSPLKSLVQRTQDCNIKLCYRA